MTETMLRVDDVSVHFPVKGGLLNRTRAHVKAVDGISLTLEKGDSLALVGESGSGKTTLSNVICMLESPTAGSVQFQGRDLCRLGRSERHRLRQSIQIVFQDPFWSLDPRWLVRDIVGEPIKVHYGLHGDAYQDAVVEALELVGLGAAQLFQYPHELTGGVRQRVAIARALSARPELLVLDEPTSAIDVLSQHQILVMLQSLKESLGLTFVLVSHDLSVVGYLATTTAVMYAGLLMEHGRTEDVFAAPLHPYTKAMLGAVPTFGSYGVDSLVSLSGEVASAVNPPDGCRFHPRCDQAMDVCAREAPPRVSVGDGHYAYCWGDLK